jgi:hypothetical protein
VIGEADIERFSPQKQAEIRTAIETMVGNGYNRMDLMLLQTGGVVYDPEGHQDRLIHETWQQVRDARSKD